MPPAPATSPSPSGVEKLKDTGYGGLPTATVGTYIPQWYPNAVAPANFAQLASAYRSKHQVDAQLLKRAIAHVSVKSHANGAKNPKAHFRSPVTEEQVLRAPIIAEPLGLYDCAGVSDGAAAVIVTTQEIARSLGKKDLITFKALQIAVVQRLGDAVERVGRQLPPHHPDRREEGLRRGRHRGSAQGAVDDRGARLLLHHRAGDDGGPRPVRRRAGA